ncbi:gp16 family protein [Shewanella algae]|uniref:gp16 family protein n=1 Tax=Shewanella algae TaxID=38313 RepID=UPI001AAFB837|nr:regulatory protein GemA [Shewanella algae]MBO2589348.1 regulatory protein GemA [Shewanella algae]
MSNSLKLVQIGKRELHLDDDMYRNLLEKVTGKRSAKELDEVQLKAVIAEMKAQGFKPKSKRRDRAPEVAKIRAIWLTMFAQGFVRSNTEVALNTYVKRMTKTDNGQGVDRVNWLRSDQAAQVLEALKKWHYREMAQAIIASGGSPGRAGYEKLANFYAKRYQNPTP